MTTPLTERIPLDGIVWEPRPGTDFTDLVESFEAVGQLHPVTVFPGAAGTWVLVAGRRRVAAARKLKWTHIDALLIEEGLAQDAQFYENLSRRELSGAEAAEALAQFKRRRSTEFVRPEHLVEVEAVEPALEFEVPGPLASVHSFTEEELATLIARARDEEEWANEGSVEEALWGSILAKLEGMQ